MKTHVLKTARSIPLTALRVGAGVVMAAHGGLKFWDLSAAQQSFESIGIPFAGTLAVLTAIAELAGGIGLVLGLLTPIASLAIVMVMAGAIGFVHAPNGLFAKDGGFEYPLTMGLVALFYVFRGAGPISVDAWLATRRPSASAILGRHPAEVSA